METSNGKSVNAAQLYDLIDKWNRKGADYEHRGATEPGLLGDMLAGRAEQCFDCATDLMVAVERYARPEPSKPL